MKRKERLGEIAAQWAVLWKWIGCLAHLSVIHTQFELELQLSPRQPLNHRNNLLSAYPTISWTCHSLWFPHHLRSVALTLFDLHKRMNCSSWEKHCHLCFAASGALRLLSGYSRGHQLLGFKLCPLRGLILELCWVALYLAKELMWFTQSSTSWVVYVNEGILQLLNYALELLEHNIFWQIA